MKMKHTVCCGQISQYIICTYTQRLMPTVHINEYHLINYAIMLALTNDIISSIFSTKRFFLRFKLKCSLLFLLNVNFHKFFIGLTLFLIKINTTVLSPESVDGW